MYAGIIPMSDMAHCHIDLSRLLDFFMSGMPLTLKEHHHFLYCEACTCRIADRLLEEIKKGGELKGIARQGDAPRLSRHASLSS